MNYCIAAAPGARRNILTRLLQTALEGIEHNSTTLGHCHNHHDTNSKLFYDAWKPLFNTDDAVFKWSPAVFNTIYERGEYTDTIITVHLSRYTVKKFVEKLPNFKLMYVHFDTLEEAYDSASAWFFKDIVIESLRANEWPLEKMYDIMPRENARRKVKEHALIQYNDNRRCDMSNVISVAYSDVLADPVKVIQDFVEIDISEERLAIMRRITKDYESKQHYYKEWYTNL